MTCYVTLRFLYLLRCNRNKRCSSPDCRPAYMVAAVPSRNDHAASPPAVNDVAATKAPGYIGQRLAGMEDVEK